MQEDYRTVVIKNIFKDITNLKSVIKETRNAQDLLEKDEDLENLENHINSTKKIVRSLKKSVDKIYNYFDNNYKSWTKNSGKTRNDKDDNARKVKSNSLKKTIKDKAKKEEVTDQSSNNAELPPDVSLNDCEVAETPPEQQLDDVSHKKGTCKESTEKEEEELNSQEKKKVDQTVSQENEIEEKDDTEVAEEVENDTTLVEDVPTEKEAVTQNKKCSLENDSQDENDISKPKNSQNVKEIIDYVKEKNETRLEIEKEINKNKTDEGADNETCESLEQVNINKTVEETEKCCTAQEGGKKDENIGIENVTEVEQNLSEDDLGSHEKVSEKEKSKNLKEKPADNKGSDIENEKSLEKEKESISIEGKEGKKNQAMEKNDIETDDNTTIDTSKDNFDDDPSIEIINDSLKSEEKDVNVKIEPETFGKIKLVCLSKLIDPIHKTPKVEDSIVILSDSDDEPIPLRKYTRNSSRESHKNNKASPKLNTSKSILKVRNLGSMEDLEKSPTPKKVQFADKDKLILSKIQDSDDSSDSNSEQDESRGKSKKKKGLEKKEECLAPDGLDAKFSWKSYVKLRKIPAEKLKAEYMKKMEKLELKRLVNMKTLRKRSRTNTDSSSSDESTTKPVSKKKSQKTEKPEKKVTQLKHSDSSESSDIEENTKIDTIVEAVDSNITEMNGTDTEMDFQNDMDSIILDSIVGSDEDNSDTEKEAEECAGKRSSDSDDENNTKNGDGDAKIEENDEKEEKSEEAEKQPKKIKKPKKDSDDSYSENEEDDTKKGSSAWKRDKLLTEKLSDSDSDIFERVKKITKRAQAKSTTKKKPKRIIPDSDSDESKDEKSSDEEDEGDKKESSSDSETKREAAKKKSRKRIKKVNESSSDDEDKSTRKQIRKVLNRDSLAETTKQAEKEEAERKARISERQKKYNDIFEADKLEKSTLNKVVLDFNEETNEELLVVHEDLVKHLKPHQGKGVQFMWDACFESIDRAKNTVGSGCILAHCMGLGKTLQVITLSHTLLTNSEKTGVRKVLVVCPLSTVLNWVSEYKKWLPSDDEFEVYDLVSYKQNRERAFMTSEWHKNGGVLVLGYDMFRNLSNDTNKRITKKMRLDFKRNLVDPGPDLVVCDEGHLLKNEKTSLSISMNKLKTVRRIVLTGTPLQNNLKEYWCMVQFVKPNLLGTYKEYLNRFVNPITNGQYTDSTPHDIQIMRKRSHVLHKLLDGIVQRRDYSVLAPFLPPKHEYILFVSLTETQVKLYSHYLKEFAQQKTSTRSSFLFVDFQELQRICTHPRVLLDKSIQNKIAQEKKDWENDDESEGSIKDFIDDGSDSASDSTPNSSSGEEDDKPDLQKNKYRRRTRATAEVEGPEVVVLDEEDDGPQEWWRQYTQGDELDNIIHSGKLHLLFEILHQCELIGDKVLVFSQSLYSLNVIEYFLSKIDEASQNDDTHLVGGYNGSWALGLDYFRLDGSSSCDNRAAWCKTFNNPENTRARLFLISTRAGGLGINLVAANRVIIFDVSWNPSHDIQSIYRVYRFGQLKPSYIYRFVTMGTMEMKIYERQVTKQAISKRVIDEQQIDRHYNQNDLQELYKFEPEPEEVRPTPLVPKDILLGELLQSHKTLIYKYHEHQSLLENKEDEVLDEAERKAAWEEFENEKKARHLNTGAYTGNINQIPMGSIVTALTNIIKREQPTFTLNEINGVMPQLVQELNGQMRIGDFTMYNKIINEIKNVQTQVQQQKLQEYYQMQQQQKAIQMFQKYQQQFQSSGVSPTDTANFVQQWQNAAAASGNTSGRNVPTIDPEVIRLDD